MLLHKITYQIKTEAPDAKVYITRSKWCGSQQEAGANRRIIRQMHGYIPNSVQTEKVDVPTKKKALVDFLNVEIAQ